MIVLRNARDGAVHDTGRPGPRPPRLARALMRAALMALAAFPAAADGAAAGPAGTRSPAAAVRFVSYGQRDGLANTSVSSFAQDAAGFIWIGTQGGLHRWDGHSYRLYENEPFDSSSLPNNLIQTMYMDPDGTTLWIGSYGGLVRFDTRTETFQSWRHDPDDPESLSNDVVVSISRDADGRLWVGTLDGLDRLREDLGGFAHYRPDPETPGALASGIIRALFLDSRGRLWVGTSGGGLYRYLKDGDSFLRLAKGEGGPPSDYVFGISEDPSGALWFALWYWGLGRLDPATGRFDDWKLADDRAYFVNAREDGLVRVGTWGGGLFELEVPTGAVTRYRSDADSRWSLPGDTVYSMLVDRAGSAWVGTNGGGYAQMRRDPEGFGAWEHNPADPLSRAKGKTTAVLEDSRGRLWVGVYNGGLDRLDPGAAGFRHFRHDERDPRSLPDDIVNDLFEDASGTVWVSTNSGVARYDEASGRFAPLAGPAGSLAPGPLAELLGGVVYSIAQEPGGGALWFGTYTSGLVRWERAAGGAWEHYLAAADGLAGNMVYMLAFDARDRLWAATAGGLSRHEGGGRFRSYRSDPDDPSSLPSSIIRGVTVDSAGSVWVACNGGGVARYDEATDSFTHWTKPDGLPSNVVLGVLEGRRGEIWAATPRGLAAFDTAAGRFWPVGSENDLGSGEFTVGMARGRDGELYFGAVDTLYRMDPALMVRDRFAPEARLTGIALPAELPRPLTSPWFTREVTLPWNRASLSLTFAALDYDDASRSVFAYRLEGFDEDWIYSGTRSYASYTSLPPGRSYRFMVRAANGDGLWGEPVAALDIRVEGSPWGSWWAICIYAALLAGLVRLVLLLRNERHLTGRVDDLSRLKSELEAANLRLEELASHDGLTGLLNRRSLTVELDRRFKAAANLREPVAGLMLDIDSFKAYNDHYGHQDGDDALMRVSGVIARSLERPQDLAARYGGEEFFVLLPGTDLAGAALVAERLRAAVEALGVEHRFSAAGKTLTASVGAAAFIPGPGDQPERLVREADEALYRAKTEGRNRVRT